VSPAVLDSGALIALERRDRRLLAVLDELISNGQLAHVSAGVVAQVWRGSARQHDVAKLLRSGAVRIHPITDATGYQLGLLLGATGATDVVDAHVAALGKATGGIVITSDAGDIRALDPSLRIVSC
jgi:hypothetical protein